MSGERTEATLFDHVWLHGELEEHLDAVYGDGSALPTIAGLHAGPPLTYTKLALARAAGRVSRARGRGGGTAAPGRLLLRIAPGSIATLGARLRDGITLISATNGKTTTARMLAQSSRRTAAASLTIVPARTPILACARRWPRANADAGVLEVDEAWLPLLAAQLQPRLIVLGNLFSRPA